MCDDSNLPDNDRTEALTEEEASSRRADLVSRLTEDISQAVSRFMVGLASGVPRMSRNAEYETIVEGCAYAVDELRQQLRSLESVIEERSLKTDVLEYLTGMQRKAVTRQNETTTAQHYVAPPCALPKPIDPAVAETIATMFRTGSFDEN